MKLVVSGATGLVGSALISHSQSQGIECLKLVRTPVRDPAEIKWDPAAGSVDSARLEGVDAIVHLAGESIAEGRWTAEKKKRIRESRVKGTRLISETIARLSSPPRVLVCASATGYYGDRGDEVLTEDSPPGTNFVAEVCKEWEAAAHPATARGIRTVNLRIGIVLSPEGGALARMLPPFKMGIGGKIGSGRQYMSWIDIDDLISAIHHVCNSGLSGPVNAVAPDSVTNADFTKTLGQTLKRPAVFAVPAFATRLVFGEMADELLLASQRAMPVKLLASGFSFRYSRLNESLRHVLRRR